MRKIAVAADELSIHGRRGRGQDGHGADSLADVGEAWVYSALCSGPRGTNRGGTVRRSGRNIAG